MNQSMPRKNLHSSQCWEDSTIAMFRDCSIWTVIHCQISKFENMHGSHPEIVQVNRALKGPFIREMAQELGLIDNQTGQALLIEPAYIDGIPVVFTIGAKDETYMITQSKSIRQAITL